MKCLWSNKETCSKEDAKKKDTWRGRHIKKHVEKKIHTRHPQEEKHTFPRVTLDPIYQKKINKRIFSLTITEKQLIARKPSPRNTWATLTHKNLKKHLKNMKNTLYEEEKKNVKSKNSAQSQEIHSIASCLFLNLFWCLHISFFFFSFRHRLSSLNPFTYQLFLEKHFQTIFKKLFLR